jgi:hypothetical protein
MRQTTIIIKEKVIFFSVSQTFRGIDANLGLSFSIFFCLLYNDFFIIILSENVWKPCINTINQQQPWRELKTQT